MPARFQGIAVGGETWHQVFFFPGTLSSYQEFSISDILIVLSRCLMNMMRALHEEGIHTHYEAKSYIGKTFRAKIYDVAPWATDEEICDFIIK
jgi:hypothetical protein